MIFNNDPDDQDICSFADGLINTDDTSFPLKKKALYATQAVRKILQKIWNSYAGWKYDDTNNSTLSRATGTLNNGQQLYRIPVQADTLLGFSYTDLNNNTYKLNPITREQIIDKGFTIESFMNVAGNPQYYLPEADTVRIFPAANFDNPTGFHCDYGRDMVVFTPSDTTHEPGFDSRFHEAVPTFMAWQQAKSKQKPQQGGRMRNGSFTGLAMDWNDYLDSIEQHYSKKYRQLFPPRFRNRDVMADYANDSYGSFGL